MAVSRIWPVRHSLKRVIDYANDQEKTSSGNMTEEQYQALADVIQYAKNEEKTEREFYAEGINCSIGTARDSFVAVKKQFNKTDGIQAYHGYLSFKEKEVAPETAQRIGMEFAERVWGDRFQVVVTTHLNTRHLHCHFVVNSVSFVDGKRLHDMSSWFRFYKIADEICKKHELSVVDKPERNHGSYYMELQDRKNSNTRYNILRASIDECISNSSSMSEFKARLSGMGYRFNLSSDRKYWTVIPKGYERPVRLYRLGSEYTKERIYQRIHDRGKVKMETFQRQRYRPKQYLIGTRLDRLKKRSGLQRLYLYYCYLLGAIPRRKQNVAKVHTLLREDLIKIDRFSEATRLLCGKGITTAEELLSYREKLTDDKDSLLSERRQLRNAIRRKGNEGSDDIRKRLGQISSDLKNIRHEISLVDDISERSGIIQKKVSVIEKDMKEVMRNERRR